MKTILVWTSPRRGANMSNSEDAKKVIGDTIKGMGLVPVDTWADQIADKIMDALDKAGLSFVSDTDDFPNSDDN